MKKGISLLAAAALLGLAACGDDDDKESGGESGQAQTMSVAVDAQGKLTGVKALEGGVVTVNFRNGSRLPWDLQLIRVDGNQTAAQIQRVIRSEGGPIPTWLHGAGGVGGTEPGQNATATQFLPPGTYYAIAQAESEDEGEGPKPATARFQVEGGESEGELADQPATITAKDYSFSATGLKTGVNRIRFDNRGKELHHVIAFQLAPGKTVADLKKLFASEGEPSGPPPFVPGSETGTAVLDGGVAQNVELEFPKAGNWALVCFIQDRKGGPPHAAKGMITPVTVK
ncbi:MAG TPA: hypothetical protein VNB64_10480 [Solirubrobacteraceae bacterium]|nr:hypothetical protein [Solirubrobacteraceae bacterium]